MPIVIVCPGCNSKLKAPENLIGKMVKCPSCGQAVPVRAAAAPAPAPIPVPPPAPKRPARPAPPPVIEPEPVEEDYEQEAGGAALRGGPTTEKERSTAMWIHLLPLVISICCFPLAIVGPIVSIVLWASKRKDSAFIDHHGKTWLNFFINLFALGIVLGIPLGLGAGLAAASGGVRWVGLILQVLFLLILVVVNLYATVMYIVAAMKAKNGEWFEYRTLFKVLK
jgi:uncharacterized Tic20 family protein